MARTRPRRGNLPAELNGFVGRRRDVAQARRLLSMARLVTLTGVAGVGKTRLALRTASAGARAFTAGVWLVDVAAVRDGELLGAAVAVALGVPARGSRSPVEAVAGYLSGRKALLVLDGCEHLLDDCAVLAEALLGAAGDLTILATSRELLGASGEHALVIAPLPVGGRGDGDGVSEHEAVELFADRAVAMRPDFVLTEENRRLVTRVCTVLDGLPLAIELAAGRLAAMPLPEIAQRLDDDGRFTVLTARRSPREHHRTLHAAIGWSHELCDPDEKLLWARLSVFGQDFDLQAAEQVCGDHRLHRVQVVETLDRLVAKSVVVREDTGLGASFRLLESIRAYGGEWLDRLGESAELRRRHRDWYLCAAWTAEAAWSGPDQEHWAQRCRRDLPNLRNGFDYSLAAPGEASLALAMAGSLWFLWVACGQIGAGRRWLDQALDAAPDEPTGERIKALWVVAWIATLQGDMRAATARLAQCREHMDRAGDETQLGYWLQCSGHVALLGDDFQAASELLEQALLQHGGQAPLDPAVLPTQVLLATCWIIQDRPRRATELMAAARELSDAAGERWMRSHADFVLALAMRQSGDMEAAARHAADALCVQRTFRDVAAITGCLELLATALSYDGDPLKGARLLGHSERLRATFGLPHPGSAVLAASRRECEERLRASLGDAAFAEARALGRSLTLDEALADALDEPSRPRSRPAPRDGQALTARQRQVADLVNKGLTNRQIADSLAISAPTVHAHVEAILNRLNLTSRTQIATWTPGSDHWRLTTDG
ncbi:LuxR C-terminal-related transcriptional regulator [Actinomadura rupiterrae]|uniref:LuxR C-terminal-related transcriptional regulator n=1 Tax=Actinomadura rupiterrae TaxID=559627 RepID=UPI0020A30870|nr:LuxR C-terminal-related transcriptional regulator [Actinomadura rupiterrae]MCP2338930.1 non-specific serine/threonine protein kinase [Actinomadura rupiterrae]